MEGGKPDALPSRGAGDSQRGTTFSSDRAVQGLPEVRSAPPPLSPTSLCSHLPLLLTLCPSPLISASHTATLFCVIN